jgi:ribonuclease HI
LEGEPQTNNRAELTGILRALEIASRDMDRDMEILTDSNYSINCCTVWFSSWIKKGWMTSTGKPVENKDLIEQILAELDKRERAGVKTKFTWVQGHANDYGNEAADKLANLGTDKNIARRLRGL